MNKWESKNFCGGDGNGCVLNQLTDFLNENDIEDFKIILSQDNYLEIVYKK